MLETHHIEAHFTENRAWAKLFKSRFPNWTPATWVEDVWSIFEANGYRYEIERYSNNPESKVYCAVKCVDLFGPITEDNDDGFIVGYGDSHDSVALEQMLISVICNFDVDFTKFK